MFSFKYMLSNVISVTKLFYTKSLFNKYKAIQDDCQFFTIILATKLWLFFTLLTTLGELVQLLT